MNPIDTYLSAVSSEYRETLEDLRKTILEIIPDAEESISYGMPAFKIGGKSIIWFAAFKRHMSIFPISESILEAFAIELTGYTHTKSALHFTPEKPLPKKLVRRIIEKRMNELKV